MEAFATCNRGSNPVTVLDLAVAPAGVLSHGIWAALVPAGIAAEGIPNLSFWNEL